MDILNIINFISTDLENETEKFYLWETCHQRPGVICKLDSAQSLWQKMKSSGIVTKLSQFWHEPKQTRTLEDCFTDFLLHVVSFKLQTLLEG